MKQRHVLSLVAFLVPFISALSLQAYECKKKEKCPITHTVCPEFTNGNGFRVTNPDAQGADGLEAAINAANASNATKWCPFVIEFAVADTPITGAELPAITKPICIDGFSNQGANECNRTITLTCELGLVLTETACGSTVKGINFVGASPQALLIQSSHTRVYGNNISGKDNPDVLAFQRIGIIVDGARDVTIGGLKPHERNIIEFTVLALLILSDQVTVVGNYIGPNEHGNRTLFDNGTGDNLLGNIIGIIALGNNLTIGCAEKCGGNVISANLINALLIGSCIKFTKNLVGLDACGTKQLFNLLGVLLIGPHNKVSKSVISGNLLNNLLLLGASYSKVTESIIGTDVCGKRAFFTLSNFLMLFSSQNCVACNLITAQTTNGISVIDSSSNSVTKNVIGSNCAQTTGLGQQVGVHLGTLDTDATVTSSTTRAPEPHSELVQDIVSQKFAEVLPHIEHNEELVRAYLEAMDRLAQLHPVFSLLPRNGQSHTTSQERNPFLHRSCQPCRPKPGFIATLPELFDQAGNIIAKNTILGNLHAGILAQNARDTLIKANYIGINKKCCIVPNGYGALLTDGSQCNKVTGNVIAGNLFNGVAVQGTKAPRKHHYNNDANQRNSQYDEEFTQTFANAILKNAIFNNCRSGIKLSVCGNNCLEAPCIVSAKRLIEHKDDKDCKEKKVDKVEVELEAKHLPKGCLIIELYGNIKCREGITEGQVFLGCFVIKEPVCGTIKLIAPLPCRDIKYVSATATVFSDCFGAGNTSEFSCFVRIQDKCLKPVKAPTAIETITSIE